MEWKDDVDDTQQNEYENKNENQNENQSQTGKSKIENDYRLHHILYVMYGICVVWICIGIFGSIGKRCSPVTLLNPLYWISLCVVSIHTYRSQYMVNIDTHICESSNQNINTPFTDVLLTKVSLLLSLLFFCAFIYKILVVNVALHNLNVCQASRQINKLYHIFIFYILSEILHFVSFINKNAYPAMFTSNILWLTMIFIVGSLLLYLFSHSIQSIYLRKINILFTLPLFFALLYSSFNSVAQIISGNHDMYKGLDSLPGYFSHIHEKLDEIRSCKEFGSFSQLFGSNYGETYVRYLGVPMLYTYFYLLYENQFM